MCVSAVAQLQRANQELIQDAGDSIFVAALRRLIEAGFLIVSEVAVLRDPQTEVGSLVRIEGVHRQGVGEQRIDGILELGENLYGRT